ncbi:olfactory receptor 4Q3-like [Pogona vitticeps]
MNTSGVPEFIFVGLPHSRLIQLLLFAVVLACYVVVLFGNLVIVVTVYSEPRLLQSPMYFFLTHLSILDIAFGSVAVPRLLGDLVKHSNTISFGGCMSQLFFFHFFGGSEMLILVIMAYDRYMAICYPLMYMTSMNRPRCTKLLLLCWIGGFIHSMSQMALILRFPFCGPNELDNFFCDVQQVVKLACTDTYITEILVAANSGLLCLVCFTILLVSYGVLLATLRGHFRESGRKALSTCSSHLVVVTLLFLPCLFVYVLPFSSSVQKVVSVFYTVITPGLNPIIYTLRNQEMKEAMGRIRNKSIFSHCCVNQHKIRVISPKNPILIPVP